MLASQVDPQVIAAPPTHYSLTRYLAEVLGVKPWGIGQRLRDMASTFGLGIQLMCEAAKS